MTLFLIFMLGDEHHNIMEFVERYFTKTWNFALLLYYQYYITCSEEAGNLNSEGSKCSLRLCLGLYFILCWFNWPNDSSML